MIDASKTLLCIDDEESGLKCRKLLLESCGFTVLTASGGKEGLGIFKSRAVDGVVVDYFMPEMDGRAVSAEMKNVKPRTPVIMLSGYPSVPEEVRDVVDAFIEKTQDPSLLINRVESLVRLRSHSHPELQTEYVVFVDSSRRYLDCSDAVCRLLGYSRMELLNMTIDDVSYRAEKVPVLFEQYVQQGKLDGQYVLRHRSGKPLFIRYRAHAFPDGCLAAIWEPIKGWKQLYQTAMLELRPDKLNEALESAQLAIQHRMQELAVTNQRGSGERQEIEDALSGLRVLARELPDSKQ